MYEDDSLYNDIENLLIKVFETVDCLGAIDYMHGTTYFCVDKYDVNRILQNKIDLSELSDTDIIETINKFINKYTDKNTILKMRVLGLTLDKLTIENDICRKITLYIFELAHRKEVIETKEINNTFITEVRINISYIIKDILCYD